jgi:DNA repair exonuclease SbcCD ATPase subunit
MEKELSLLKKRSMGLAKSRKSLEKELRGIDIGKLRKDQQEVVGKYRGMESEMKGIQALIDEKRATLNELKSQKETFEKYKEEVDEFGKMIDYMDKFVEVLRMTQDQLRDEFLKTVNFIMNDVWGELYPYSDFSEIRLAVEKDYVLQLKGSSGWVSADIVSGGERSLAALALRIAFSLAFTPNLRWLILDEPTHNLDVNAIEHFGGVLRERMGNIIDQVFLITHEERLSDYITGSTYKLERNKDADGVTKIAVN